MMKTPRSLHNRGQKALHPFPEAWVGKRKMRGLNRHSLLPLLVRHSQ